MSIGGFDIERGRSVWRVTGKKNRLVFGPWIFVGGGGFCRLGKERGEKKKEKGEKSHVSLGILGEEKNIN